MAWIYLITAGLLEVVWAYFLKQSDGFTRPLPTLVTVVALGASLGLLALSLRSLPLGSAYAIWTGIGAVGAFGVGVLLFGEALTPMRVCAALMILGGIVLMKLSADA